MSSPSCSYRPSRDSRAFSSCAGLTLVEVTVSATVLALLMLAILNLLLQSRRLTDGSIYQGSALTVVQGYVEQIKNMEFASLPYYDNAGMLHPGSADSDDAASLNYYDSSGVLKNGAGTSTADIVSIRLKEDPSPPVPPLPAGVRDALRLSTGTPPALNTITPGGLAPAGVVDVAKFIPIISDVSDPKTDLQLKIWVWIQDISDPSIDATQALAVTIIYHWRTNDGGRSRWFLGTVRTIRSVVPSF